MEQELDEEHRKLLVDWFENGIPFNVFMGLRVDVFTRGRVVLRIPWREELLGDTLRQAVHGGVTSMLADTAGGAACFTMLDRASDRVSTVDLRVDYLRPGAPADLVCEARILRMGNRVAVVKSSVYSGDLPGPDSTILPFASAQGVYNVVRRE